MQVQKTPLPESIPSGELPTLLIEGGPGITVVTGPGQGVDPARGSVAEGIPPEIIGGYKRLRPLGVGGMGQVFLAEDHRLKRQVALKLLRGNVIDEPIFVERFLRESKTMAQVNHPNVVGIHGAGEQGGWLWMALEYVPGSDLNRVLKARGRLEEPEVLKLLIACCKGLEAIHAAGLVHRDIKPANIFLDRDGVPKIGDLGLARHADGEDRMTMTGHAWGTPAYMSPEQVQGVGDIDIRSDVYALGVVAFILLAGSEPFTGPTSYVVTNLVLTQPAPDVRSRNRTVSPGLAAVIRCCLEKDRNRRYADPTAMRVDLERLVGGLPLATAQQIALPTLPSAATSSSSSLGSPGSNHGGGMGHLGNPVLIKLAVYGIAASLIGLVVWSVQGQTVAHRREPAEANAPAVPVVVREAGLESWMAHRGRDAQGEWATVRLAGPAIRLRLIPAGTFPMGSPTFEAGRSPTETLHQVTLTHAYWLAETEVTQELYRRVTGDSPAQFPGDDRPVEQVHLHDVRGFLTQLAAQVPDLNPRLPTEAEWERACRAGGDRAFGRDTDLSPREWVQQPADGGSRPVAKGLPNAFGLFDMAGNVREWCADSWEDKPLPQDPVTDPVGTFGALVVCRGGSYLLPPSAARAAARTGLKDQERRPDLGFRFAVDAP